MQKSWHDEAWDGYLYWQTQDRKTLRRINALIKAIERGDDGETIGRPELLKGDLSGWASVRIDQANRLVYRIREGVLEILSVRGHYL